MAKKISISPAEWPVMEALWEKGTATAAELVAAVGADREVSMRTTKTHIRRLVNKGAVDYTVDPGDSRVYHYRPSLTRVEALHLRKRSILADLFGGDPVTLLDHFLEDGSLTDEEIARIHGLLRRKRKGGEP